jgi:SAM-dependent methyltransferase
MTPANHEIVAPVAPMTTAAPSSSGKARFWDKIARKYAADPIEDMAGYEATLARTQALLSPSQRVLEIGCGTGSTALRLAPFTGQLVATDVSAAMITIAREKLAAAPQPNLAFELADADAPAGHGHYDVVLAFNLLHLVADLDSALASAAAALAPGGLLVSKTACISEMNVLVPKLLLPLMRLVGKAPPVLCFAASALEAAIARHGLDIVAVERHGTKGKDIRVFIVARKRG